MLYTAQFGQRQGYLYLLVEHQSTPDKLMPYRLLKYSNYSAPINKF
ncbi:MAG: Rpn family recombination-promoting nuclease/putative transposase [Promethearchaeota archaeon]